MQRYTMEIGPDFDKVLSDMNKAPIPNRPHVLEAARIFTIPYEHALKMFDIVYDTNTSQGINLTDLAVLNILLQYIEHLKNNPNLTTTQVKVDKDGNIVDYHLQSPNEEYAIIYEYNNQSRSQSQPHWSKGLEHRTKHAKHAKR